MACLNPLLFCCDLFMDRLRLDIFLPWALPPRDDFLLEAFEEVFPEDFLLDFTELPLEPRDPLLLLLPFLPLDFLPPLDVLPLDFLLSFQTLRPRLIMSAYLTHSASCCTHAPVR